MEPQAFDRKRRIFLLASAIAAAGAVVACEQPQGLKRPRTNRAGSEPGPGPAATPSSTASSTASTATSASASTPTGARDTASKSGSPTDPPATPTAKPAPPTERPQPPSSEPAIRIKSGSLPKSDPKVRIDGPGASLWIIEPGSGKGGTVGACPIEFAWTDNGWRVTEAAGTAQAQPLGVPARATLEITALRGETQQLRLFGSTWPGKVRLVPQPNDPFEPVDVVHEVAMETYLPGVITRELFNKWTPNTHRAQAVAARSWALCEMENWRTRRHFDVVAGEQGQAWVGETKHQRSLDAVHATRGEVLLFDGRVVPAYYSSCCGGQRASARDAISSSIMHDIAPLQVAGIDRKDCCSTSPTYRWQSKFDINTFARTLPQWARAEGYASLFQVDGLRRVDIVARNAAGRPIRFQITDAKGQVYEVFAERLRYALNADPARPAELRPSKERVKSAFFEPLIVGRELVVSGRGHGHGVGMCQYGAEAMAKKGSKPAAILARYYPGATVLKSYA